MNKIFLFNYAHSFFFLLKHLHPPQRENSSAGFEFLNIMNYNWLTGIQSEYYVDAYTINFIILS